MRRVIAVRAALDARRESGLPAATFAAGAGSWQALALLIDMGADVTIRRDRGERTALYHPAKRGHVRFVRALLGAGADLDARDSEGKTALVLGTTADKPAVLELSRSCSALVLR
jgi:ankyrin repeat protein